ncbi:alpha/beta-hydrolase [Athelia psychrophila]|uniref:Alpha/beta-hydrolase n=1 Tax=Athelia psychrophila TaxID=1759441 RepID=A0A166HF33_9AGAM|nr:alpha/beta-hydrolase [Fibularhizoctonia sp. CBS 109695]
MSALKFFIGCCLVLPGLVSVSAFPVAAPSPLLRLRVRDRYLTSRSGNSTSSTSPVSNATIESTLVRPAEFSRTAYCGAAVASWDCGPPCDALPGVEVLTVGGDGGLIPFYFIAHDPATQSIVVAHQGTNESDILSIANDAEFLLSDLNTTLFPKAPSGVQVHDGFQKTFGRTSDSVLSGVQSALATTGVNKVLVTGHSLGAAISTMDALMLRLNLPTSVEMTAAVFGLPRGGNQAYADFIDSTLGANFTYVTNQHDPVPTVPPQFLSYKHSAGEIHIQAVNAVTGNATSVVSCPGQENINCIDGNNPLADNTANHIGPYFNNISMSRGSCPS